MRRTLTTLLTVSLMTITPGLIGNAFAHGGSYRGPAGEVPPDSREPSDPPPPTDPTPPQTPGGDGEGPTTGGDVGGPGTGGGDGEGPSTGGDGGAPPPDGGGGPGGPTTGGGPGGPRRGGGAKGPGYEDWTFWWNFNKDEIVQLKSAVKKLQAGSRSGSIAHKFGRNAQRGDEVKTATDAAIQEKIVPALRTLLDDDDLNFDIQSASAIALAKIGDESIIEVLKRMSNNEKQGSGNYHKVVRESAGLAFGLLQKDSEDVRSFLIESIKNSDLDSSFVHPFSAISLGLLGDANDPDGASMNALIDVVAGKEKKGEVKPAALVALGLLGNDSAVNDLLFMLENGKANRPNADELSDVELAFVVQALGKIGEPGLDEAGKETAVLETVLKLTDAKKSNKADKNVKRSAAIALGQLAAKCSAKQQGDIVKALNGIVMEKKNDSSMRNFAAISIGRIGATKGIEADTRKFAISTLKVQMNKAKPKSICQPFAGIALGLIGRAIGLEGGDRAMMEEEIRKPLRDKFEETSAPRPKGAYAIASGLVRDPLAVKSLIETLEEKGDNKLRGYCAVALGLIGDENGRQAIKAALTTETDRDLRVQTAVAAGLIGDAGVIKNLVQIIESKEESQYILGSVALSLGQIGDENSIDPMVRIALDEGNDFPDLTRALATVALGQIGDRRDVPVLSRLARDFNYRAHVPSLAELLTIL